MAGDTSRVYWDSCVFIDGLRKTADRWPHIEMLEKTARGGGIAIYTSTLSVAEVVKMKEHGDLTDQERQQIASYFRHSFVKVIPVDRVIARAAAEIVRVNQLKPPDAIHVATALRVKASVLYTYDGVGGEKEKMIGKSGEIEGLLIKPPGYDQQQAAEPDGLWALAGQ